MVVIEPSPSSISHTLYLCVWYIESMVREDLSVMCWYVSVYVMSPHRPLYHTLCVCYIESMVREDLTYITLVCVHTTIVVGVDSGGSIE